MNDPSGNLFKPVSKEMPDELVTVIAENKDVKIERIVSDGHRSPEGFWYDQDQNEWVTLLSGSAVLLIEKPSGCERIELGPGDHLLIPPHQRHRIEATSQIGQTIWLAVFY